MEDELRGRFIRSVPSPDGPQADIALIEPNGNEFEVRCLIRKTGTDIGGNPAALQYLHNRYGGDKVCLTAQGTVLGI